MAEAVVSIALQTISHLLSEEGRFLAGVGDQVRKLQWQLKEMKCFLKDADKRRHESSTIFNWISEIRDLVYRSESAIERHAAYQVSSRRRGLTQLVRNYSCILDDFNSLHQLGAEISQITSTLEMISDAMQVNGIKRSIINNPQGDGESSTGNNMSRKTFPDLEMGDCFLGMEDEVELLVQLLGKGTEDRIISVWGMGGSGKTAIAKKLYNGTTDFDLSAWVCITQQCESRSVWEDVLRQLENKRSVSTSSLNDEPREREEVPSLSSSELIERLCEIQREKRCLIVLDDLWELSHWDELKHPFIVQNLQSKILVTTRKQTVAEIGLAVKHGLLHMDAALELLKNKAFPHGNIPDFALEETFKKIGKEMVHKCGYLPLAISLLGGVLRKKNSMVEWELVNEDIKEVMYRDEKQIDGVLNLSYESLPYYLKPCFLYMGIFYEDETIDAWDLYNMWIAQGMISYENIGDKDTLMDIAELYLSELASRSIVQVEINYNYDVVDKTEKYATCKLHDVVRELCLKLGKREDFGVQSLEYQGGKFSTLLLEASSHMKIQHLAIRFRSEVEHELIVACGEDTSEHIRSIRLSNLIGSNVIEFPPQSIVDFQKFNLLRELVIVRFKFAGRKLPRGITKLAHLRLLRIEECELDNLPSSMRHLVYMDTLDLRRSMNIKVPNVFKEMLRLKHLFYQTENIRNYRVRLDEGVYELETLVCFDSRCHELKCMDRMKNLRNFIARIHDNESLSAVLNGIMNWNKIRNCGVCIEGNCDLTSERMLEKALTCPNLYELSIRSKIGKALEKYMIDLLSSKLKCLNLHDSAIEDDPMGILGKLPCLIKLRLYMESFVGEEMTCPAKSFLRLKRLTLRGLPKLKEWRVESGAMPILSKLTIGECSCLEMVPEGLSAISTLQTLIIKRMPKLRERVSPSGQDFHKVRHVPSIIIKD